MATPSDDAPCASLHIGWQLAAWLVAIGVSMLGLFDAIAEFSPEMAALNAVWLLAGGVCWLLVRQRPRVSPRPAREQRWSRLDTAAAAAIGMLAGCLAAGSGALLGPLPPAYHDEYSYLFGAQSVLAGRWTWPSHPSHPELFDQFHVLNEGIMASRYYPGTATWMAPWLALGNPWVGHWLAGALAAAAVYGIGRELGGRRCGMIAGVLFAAAPGPALFANLLLAHHPTLLGLMVFVWGFACGQRTQRWTHFLIAGIGLGCAQLCRPATAAGVALPFGIWCLISAARQRRVPAAQWLALGAPLAGALGVMLAYNQVVAGSWWTSPYQLYTEIYTPRHVYGLNNVLRGERRLGPKVLDDYDRWAENLTPSLAWRNVLNRLLATGSWTLDLPLLALTAVLAVPLCLGGDVRWRLAAWAIASLHAIHWPYWYVGIMGWHYVFESAPLWCLLCGRITDELFRAWSAGRRDVLPFWWCGLAVIAWGGMYADGPETPSRWRRGLAVIEHPRRQHAEFRRWLEHTVGPTPALVLVDPRGTDPHLDFVINAPGWESPLLVGRYRPGHTDLEAVVRDFPDRRVWYCRPDRGELRLLSPPQK